MFKVIYKDTRTTSMCRSGVFTVNFESISHFVLVFLLLTLNMNSRLGQFQSGSFSEVLTIQKQQPEVFYEKRCSLNFRNIHRKTPVLESLFNEIFSRTVAITTLQQHHTCFPWTQRRFGRILNALGTFNLCPASRRLAVIRFKYKESKNFKGNPGWDWFLVNVEHSLFCSISCQYFKRKRRRLFQQNQQV